ncbi:MAG: hypothetical protein EOO55_03100 [Hymenobacter sp.]|nr:MAG: hypothetical protein EOO55_03100 [Hymenobacter sp.]
MKRFSISALLLAGALSNYCHAQAKITHPAKATITHTETLTNSGVVALTGAGLSPELITTKIESSACTFDLSTNSLVALKKAGVNDAVLQAMMSRGSGKAGAAAKPKPGPTTGKTPKLEIANHPYFRTSTGAWSPLEKATSSMKSKMIAMGYGGVKMLFQIPNEKSPTRFASTDSTTFLINTFGTAMPELVLYQAKLEQGNRAAVGAKVGGLSGISSGQDVITFNVLPIGNGIFRLVPSKKLLPGEYFFAGKPVGNVMTVDAYAFGVD